MTTSGSQNDNEEKRSRRDLLLFLLILLLGCACLALMAQLPIQMAVQLSRFWQEPVNMLSRLNPDDEEGMDGFVEPLLPEILTAPPWDINTLLTPGAGATLVPPIVFLPTGTPTAPAVAVLTPTPTTTSTPTRTPTSTPTQTPTPSPTPTSTSLPTGTPAPTSTPTNTPLPPPTIPPPPPPTITPPPPPTNTPTPAPAPIVLSISPNTAVNTANVPVNITGQYFQPGCSATLDGTGLIMGTCNPNNISAQVPAGIVAGYYDLTVTNPDLQSGSLIFAYTATNPIPVITAITPTRWFTTTNVTMTIDGANFRNTGAPPPLRASLNGTALLNVTYFGPTRLRALVPSTGMAPLGLYTLNVTNPGPTDPTGSLVDGFRLDYYTTTATCTGTLVVDCTFSEGPPDGLFAAIDITGTIILDFGAGNGITDGPGPDMVFYERPNPPGILLDFIQIELSDDGSTWYSVFNWDGIAGGVLGTNIQSYAASGPGEEENEPVLSSDLYPPPGTGITIDIAPFGIPAVTYRYVRLTQPPGATQFAEIDAIQTLP